MVGYQVDLLLIIKVELIIVVLLRGVYTMAKVLGFPPAARKLITNAEVEVDD